MQITIEFRDITLYVRFLLLYDYCLAMEIANTFRPINCPYRKQPRIVLRHQKNTISHVYDTKGIYLFAVIMGFLVQGPQGHFSSSHRELHMLHVIMHDDEEYQTNETELYVFGFFICI